MEMIQLDVCLARDYSWMRRGGLTSMLGAHTQSELMGSEDAKYIIIAILLLSLKYTLLHIQKDALSVYVFVYK